MFLPCLAIVSKSRSADEHYVERCAEFSCSYGNGCLLSYEPLYGCSRACGETPRCLYRLNAARLVNDEVLDELFTDLKPDSPEIRGLCEHAAERVLMFRDDPEFRMTAMDDYSCQTAALCFLIQKTHSSPSNWPMLNRRREIDRLLKTYGR